jgi:F-type H+-transporting ATPase subunit gamma
MNSMKTLAHMETHKLAGLLAAQHRVIEFIESTAIDCLHFHPQLLPLSKGVRNAYIVIGSERGFCGDFNRRIETSLSEILQQEKAEAPKLIALGHKLHPLVAEHVPDTHLLNGASVQEEIPPLLDLLSDLLEGLIQSQRVDNLLCLFHERDGSIVTRSLLPPFRNLERSTVSRAIAPLLNQPPRQFFAGLVQHYLFAVLHWMLYASLMAENHARVSHLDGAVRHLDNQTLQLNHRYNVLRQEEIIEEIEVILLNAC